jgi:hypothetical protein
MTNISQLILARDIHLDNLRPESIGGVIQLDSNGNNKRFSCMG